jgi:hypothetical protein
VRGVNRALLITAPSAPVRSCRQSGIAPTQGHAFHWHRARSATLSSRPAPSKAPPAPGGTQRQKRRRSLEPDHDVGRVKTVEEHPLNCVPRSNVCMPLYAYKKEGIYKATMEFKQRQHPCRAPLGRLCQRVPVIAKSVLNARSSSDFWRMAQCHGIALPGAMTRSSGIGVGGVGFSSRARPLRWTREERIAP